MYIDENGDAEGNYSVVAVRDEYPETGISRMTMQPVGFFQYPGNASFELPVRVIKYSIEIIFCFLANQLFSFTNYSLSRLDFQILQPEQTIPVGWREETES